MSRILDAYYSLPDPLRKAARDFVVIFLGLCIAGGIFSQTSPDWHAVILTAKGAAGLAAWRVIRSFVENTDPPEDPTSGP
jgi:hypothetical protein